MADPDRTRRSTQDSMPAAPGTDETAAKDNKITTDTASRSLLPDLVLALYGLYTGLAKLEPEMSASRRRHEQWIDDELARLDLIEVLRFLVYLPFDDPIRTTIGPRAIALLEGRDPTLNNESWLRRAWRAIFG